MATEACSTSMLLAERQLLMSLAFVAPADRQALQAAVAGGVQYGVELGLADSLNDLSQAEYDERSRLACQAEPSAQGLDVTPLSLEVQRQLRHRYG